MIKLPTDVECISIKLRQEPDSCSNDKDYQVLTISTDNAGGGKYVIIKTPRWSINPDDIDKFAQILKDVLH